MASGHRHRCGPTGADHDRPAAGRLALRGGGDRRGEMGRELEMVGRWKTGWFNLPSKDAVVEESPFEHVTATVLISPTKRLRICRPQRFGFESQAMAAAMDEQFALGFALAFAPWVFGMIL